MPVTPRSPPLADDTERGFAVPRGPPLPPKPRPGTGSAHGASSPASGDDAGRQHPGRGGSNQQQSQNQQQQEQQQQQQQQRGEGGKQAEDDMSLLGLFRMLERRGVPSGQVHVMHFPPEHTDYSRTCLLGRHRC